MEKYESMEHPAEDKNKAAIASLRDIGVVMKRFAELSGGKDMLEVANNVLKYADTIDEFSPDEAKESKELKDLVAFLLKERDVRTLELNILKDVKDQLVHTIEGDLETILPPSHGIGFNPSAKVTEPVKRAVRFSSDLEEIKDRKKPKTGKIGF